MKKIESIESFKSFEITAQQQSVISGARSKEFVSHTAGPGSTTVYCYKQIDDNDGSNVREKYKSRYHEAGKCGDASDA